MYSAITKIISILSLLSMSLTLINGQSFSLVQENSIKVIVNNDTLLNPWTGGFNSAQISKIDLNNDQIKDLFVFDRSCDKVITFISKNNNFIYAPEYEKLFPSNLNHINSPAKHGNINISEFMILYFSG